MSQTRPSLGIIDREVGLEGRILRPLSARLLEPTAPEIEGLVDRSRLLDLSGRSRVRQYELARQYGIESIPQPSGGCLLTDPGYSQRLRELWDHDPEAGSRDINFLRIGRHFRVTEACKIIVGRNQQENGMIEAFAGPTDVLVRLKDHVGPTTIVRGVHDPEIVRWAAMLTARYGDVPDAETMVSVDAGGRTMFVTPASDDQFKPMRVGVSASRPRARVQR